MKNNKLFKVVIVVLALFLLIVFKEVITFDYCSYSDDIRGMLFCILNLILGALFVSSPLLFVTGAYKLIEEKKIKINFLIALSILGFTLFLFIYFPLIIISNPVLP